MWRFYFIVDKQSLILYIESMEDKNLTHIFVHSFKDHYKINSVGDNGSGPEAVQRESKIGSPDDGLKLYLQVNEIEGRWVHVSGHDTTRVYMNIDAKLKCITK